MSRMTPAQVERLHQMRAAGASQTAIARELGVSQSAIAQRLNPGMAQRAKRLKVLGTPQWARLLRTVAYLADEASDDSLVVARDAISKEIKRRRNSS